MRRISCEMTSSRNGALIPADLQVASPESMMGQKEGYLAVLMIDQNDCVRAVKLKNELVLMSSLTDPASFCFFTEEERVNLAGPDGLANPCSSLPHEVEVSLATWDNAEPEFFVVP